MIQVQLSNVRSFLALPYEAALAPRLRHAHRHLRQHDGVGSDFTGWVELPVNYDRGEFARIKAAAKKMGRESVPILDVFNKTVSERERVGMERYLTGIGWEME